MPTGNGTKKSRSKTVPTPTPLSLCIFLARACLSPSFMTCLIPFIFFVTDSSLWSAFLCSQVA